ncbi:phage tail spike protein [Clostridium tyrobutyricum]|uniref:phage tail spike protein n=1 Tax=Clostridium tyrobutyricum TaxID=1519 RepID=UPI003F6433B2
MICIYDKKTIKGNFDNNGLGILSEAISCYIIEELNGDYSLELEYPVNSKKAKYMVEWNIIKAEGQLFRIYKVEKSSDGKNVIKVWAKHIFYDLSYYFIESMKAENCSVKTALEKSLVGDLITIYTADSDIITVNSIEVEEKNLVEVIFSIINMWGCGELKRDNFDIKILEAIGQDAGVLIAQGKNIAGLKFNIDTTSVVTNPGHRPGFLPNFLNDMGVNVIISGGMGGGDIDIFSEKNIEVIVGAKGNAKAAVEAYLQGFLKSTGSVCHEHQHHDECGE